VRWGNNAALNGIDGNKKVKGIKRHVVVDKNGFLIAVMVTIANVVASNFKEQCFRPIHKRWIVERTFPWFDNYRRLCRNYGLTFDSAEEMVKIAAIRLLLNKI
jgi:putative transposase